MCGCFGNVCICIYCVLYLLYCLCIFILICFVCTSVKDYCHRVTTQLQLVVEVVVNDVVETARYACY
jgi:hypothetical protein